MKGATLKAVWPPATVLVASAVAVEALVRVGGVPAWLLPTPWAVTQAVWTQWDQLGPALGRTVLATLMGFAASGLVGVAVAVALSSSRWVQRAFYPYAIFFQTVPIVAIAPLLVIWFGYGLRTVAVASFIVAVFPVVANTLNGLLSVDPALRDLFRLYQASRWDALWKLHLPAALPQVFTGLRIAGGLAVIGAIVAEFFVASGGLGVVMQAAMRQNRTEVVFAAIALASAVGLSLLWAVNAAAHLALRHWSASEQGG